MDFKYSGKRKLTAGYKGWKRKGNCVVIKYVRWADLDKHIEEGWILCMKDFPLCPDGINPPIALMKKKCKSHS